MKNLITITCVLVVLILNCMVQINAQPVIAQPEEETTPDCKINIVEPEFEFTYPPDDDPGDDGDDDEEEEEEEEEENPNVHRRVFFVHGYKGNEGSWSKTNNFFANNAPGNNYTSLNYGYATENHTTLDEVATQISGLYFADANTWSQESKKQNFFIAHSMGGMALRYMQNKFTPEDRPYGGIITVGSGHQGVYAANMVTGNNTKKFDDFFVNACKSLSAPKILESMPNIVYSLLSISGMFKESTITENLCEKLALPAVEFIMGEKIDDNLTTHAANSYPQQLDVKHKLALYGVEEDGGTHTVTYNQGSKKRDVTVEFDGLLLPKFFGSVINGPNTYPLWGAGKSDADGLSSWSETIYNFSIKREKANQKLHEYINGFYTILKVKKQRELVNSYDRAIRWMRNANFEYQELIGGIQNTHIIQDKCECKFWDEFEYIYLTFIYPYTGNCNDLVGMYINNRLVTESFPVITFTAQKFESDGFVLANSAQAMPGVDRPIKMQGSGHFQMRNDNNLKKEFESLIFSETGHLFFKLIR